MIARFSMKLMTRTCVAIGALFVAGAIGNIVYFMPAPVEKPMDLHRFPREFEGWASFEANLTEPIINEIDAEDSFMRAYLKGDEVITVYVGYHSSAGGGRPSHLPGSCYPSSGWRILSAGIETLSIPADGENKNRFNRMLVSKGEETRLVRYWFQTREKIMATGWDLNLFRIRSRLTRQPYGSAFVRLSTPIADDNLHQAEKLIDSWTEKAILFLSDPEG